MFIAGIRKVDRVRGEGWLDCPNCHEHAGQDVVDKMKFAGLGFYRFFPVSRRRLLICRRCNFQRPATAAEMTSLRTVSRGIGRAVMLPVGMLPFLVVLIAGLALAGHKAIADSGISYNDTKLDPIAPASMKLPSTYNHSAIPDPPPVYVAGNATQDIIIRLRHYLVNDSPENILKAHLDDDVGLSATGFPTEPPKADKVKIADVDGIKASISYLNSGQSAAIHYYAFNKDGNAYILSFQTLGNTGDAEDKKVESTVVDSLKFSGKPTPAPSPSASPGSSTTTTTGSSST